MGQEGVDEQTERDEERYPFRYPNHFLSIHRIGKNATVKPKDHERNNFYSTHEANREIRIGKEFYLKGHRYVSHHGAKARYESGSPEQPEVSILLQWRNIDSELLHLKEFTLAGQFSAFQFWKISLLQPHT